MNNSVLSNSNNCDTIVIKTSIDKIILSNDFKQKLEDASDRCNKLVIQLYLFLRCWLLDYYEKNIELPKINTDIVKMAFKVLSKSSKSTGPKIKNDNAAIYDTLLEFYNKVYSELGYKNEDKIDSIHLSQILAYLQVDIVTNIENNVKVNFISYIKCYVNGMFQYRFDEIYDKYEGKERTKNKKTLRKELGVVKNDLINNTLLSDEKYHDWIKNKRKNILPTNYQTSYYYDMHKNPQKYLKYMIYMNIQLGKNNRKQFQFFPLRKECTIKYIPIDTKTLIEIFIDTNKGEYLANIDKYKNTIWSKIFKLDSKIFRKNNYNFSYMIYTDCKGVSILFTNDSTKQKNEHKNANMKDAKQKMKKLIEGKTEEEVFEFKKNLKLKKEEENLKIKNKKLEEKEKYKKLSKQEKKEITIKNKKLKEEKFQKILDEFNKLSKEEQEEEKLKEEYKKRKNQPEFPYLEELTDMQVEQLKKCKLVYCDPGKIRLLTMVDDNGVYLKYSNRQRLFETKQLEYRERRAKYKKKHNINPFEKVLNIYNSKSCILSEFKKYVSIKNIVNKLLLEKYKALFFRTLNWYAYINKQRSESNLINRIKELYGKDCKIIFGDWSVSKQMRNFMPTPMIGLKRMLRNHFEIINIDEFNISKLNHKTESKSKNLSTTTLNKKGIVVKNKDGTDKWIKLHSVLTYEMENKRMGCINRDKNSVQNMKKITYEWLYNRVRPSKYKRQGRLSQRNSTTVKVKC